MKMLYYEKPTQVFWKNPDFGDADNIYDSETEYFGGIAYHDYIICACCGAIVPLDEVPEVVELEWVNLYEEICGDADPADTKYKKAVNRG